MMKQLFVISIFFLHCIYSFANISISIKDLRQAENTNIYLNNDIEVEGIVTGVFQQSNQIGGFFVQDEKGIFVQHTNTKVNIGDLVSIKGTLTNNNNRLQLSNVSSINILSNNNAINPIKKNFPTDFSSLEESEGTLIEIDHTMVVTNNYNLMRHGQLILSSERLFIPTHLAFPKSTLFYQTLANNAVNQLVLDDASSVTFPTNNPFLDNNKTRRMGEKIDNLQIIIDQIGSSYIAYTPTSPQFYGNPRTSHHPEIGEYSIKVCGTNLEMFKTSNWGDGFGANNSTEFARQRTKILAALNAINADIYAITEIQQGSTALQNLVDGLNAIRGKNDFAFINDGDNVSQYIKSAFIYNKNTVRPYLSVRNNNNFSSTRNRKKAQAFTEISSDESFIVVVNHYKAKSGCPSSGADADQNDGQSCFNATRTQEAILSLSFIDQMIQYAKDYDVLFMGDLNSYKYEDPIQTLINGGLFDQLERFQGNDTYSYVYRGEAGYLDYALANQSMQSQITGATPWHLNADEPSQFSYNNSTYYQANMYRFSDHDPIIVGIRPTKQAPFEPINKIQLFQDTERNSIIITRAKNCNLQILTSYGQVVLTKDLNSDMEEISINQLPFGIYIAKINGAKDDTIKFMKYQ